jgi:hypothetical protein
MFKNNLKIKSALAIHITGNKDNQLTAKPITIKGKS